MIRKPVIEPDSGEIAARTRAAIFWRSGSQIAAQLVAWCATFLVIRLLAPADYGLFAMTQIVIGLMGLANGYSFTASLVQAKRANLHEARQVFGLLICLNGGLAAMQFALAPAAAAYFRQPILTDMLRVQCLVHLFTPFIMMPQALLGRRIDFATQARANLAAAMLAALTALGGALAGWGVWTLVVAPIVLFGARAVGLLLIGRWWIWPTFRFAGAGHIVRFGGTMLAAEIFWFVQTQADVFIGGRALDPHGLGLYTTALFLAQILVSKFVPALNEVAFPAYARLGADRAGIAWSFAKAVRLVMLVAMPFSLGLAVTAGPLVATMLGPHWREAVPVVRLLGFAMPFVTLQILFAPATNALGRPGIAAKSAAAGALLLPGAFLIGVQSGPVGMAAAWLCAFPLLTLLTAGLSLPVIGLSASRLLAALAPSFGAGAAMTLAVTALDPLLPALAAPLRLLALTGAGGAVYGGALLLFARPVLEEAWGLIRGRGTAAG